MATGFGSGFGSHPFGAGAPDAGPPPPDVPLGPINLSPLTPDEELFGIDFDVLNEWPKTFALARGWKNLANALGRRLLTDEGFLAIAFDGDPDYGFNVLGRLNSSWKPEDLAALDSQAEAQCRQDERVLDATVKSSFILASSTLEVDVLIETALGPFRFILRVSGVTIELLRPE